MPGPRPCHITLTASDRRRLKQRADGHKTPFRDHLRALIVLLAARGYATAVIATRLRVSTEPPGNGGPGSPPTEWAA